MLCEAAAKNTQYSSKIIDIFYASDSDDDPENDSNEEVLLAIDEQHQVIIDG